MDTTPKVTPGQKLHWLTSSINYSTDQRMFGGTATSRRADTLVVTQQLLDSNVDKAGRTFFDLLHDEAAQVARWGKPIFAPGEAPEGLTRWEAGSAEQDLFRDRARAAAVAISDPVAQAHALREVSRIYGIKSTQQSTEVLGGRFA
jgi:hypothetical protein